MTIKAECSCLRSSFFFIESMASLLDSVVISSYVVDFVEEALEKSGSGLST